MLNGIDVSHHNGVIDWTKKKVGLSFAFCKATEGVNYVDPTFASNWKHLKESGLYYGAYHFFHPNQDPIIQANRFLRVVGDMSKNQLPHVLDWESLDGIVGKTNKEKAKAFLETVEKQTGVAPIIYASPGFLEGLGSLVGFEKYPLWIAHYRTRMPRIPKPFPRWTFWQTSDAGGLDIDLFNGKIEQLAKFAKA